MRLIYQEASVAVQRGPMWLEIAGTADVDGDKRVTFAENSADQLWQSGLHACCRAPRRAQVSPPAAT
jgi:hypothetical protein